MCDEGPQWSVEKCNIVDSVYRNWLKLVLLYPNQAIVPNKDIDEFWHTHILDTAKYAYDCEQIFGYFLHHFPYFGLRGESDKADLESSFKVSCDLYKKEFGSTMSTEIEFGSSNAKCGFPGCGHPDCAPTGCDAPQCSPNRINSSVRPTLLKEGGISVSTVQI